MSARRYAHALCAGTLSAEEAKIEQDKKALKEYIDNLLGENKSSVKINRQIKEYVDDLGYSYSGILRTLKYFYEVKQNPIDKANGGIGIVPFVYPQARNYYYEQWLLQQKNKEKDVSQYVPKVKEITIKPPARQPKKRRIFMFLDEEAEGDIK